MSLQVNDPRSRTRSRSPGRSRERSPLARQSLAGSLALPRAALAFPGSRNHPRSPRGYGSDDDAELDRKYKLVKESRSRESDEPRSIVSRAPRSPARFDVDRSDSEDESKRRRDRDRDRDRERDVEKVSQRRRDDRYEHSENEDDRDVRIIRPRDSRDPRDARESREYTSRSHQRRPSSPPGRDSRHDDSDEDSDDHLAYGDSPGAHPSYARPNKYKYAQPTHYIHAQPVAPRQPIHADPPSDWASIPESERPGFVPPSSEAGVPSTMPGGFPTASTYAEVPATTAPTFPMPQYAGLPAQQPIPYAPSSSGAYTPSHYRTASASDAAHPTYDPHPGYARPAHYQYAQVDPHVRYTSKATPVQPYSVSPQEQFKKPPPPEQQPVYPYRYSRDPQFVEKSQPQQQQQHHPAPQHPQHQPQHLHQQQVVEITPGGGRGRPHSLSVSSGNNLAVAGAHSTHAGHHPPASPLLEAYRGTYQTISPMPSPIVMPSRDDDISDLEPLDGDTSNSETRRRKKHTRSKSSTSGKESRPRSSKEKIEEKEKDDKRRSRTSIPEDGMIVISPTTGRKRVSFYDAGADASAMQSALNHARNIDNKTIIQVLPRLTSDEILLLRQEYKNKVKLHGKGINLAKHLRLKLGNSSFGKVAYATALGRWESEAYWANCYYQAGTSRRELLIESLIGRSNAAIREIKACFRDTRYGDSLERCMKSELKADKFRTAIMLALEERRQDDREPLDPRLVRQDVQDLHRALISREGGETAMVNIIVVRSDPHLREVLHEYEDIYRQNFARAMISKSQNLVGETLAHILNGAINRPLRDALLLHQAVRESRTGRERSELLISRLVRLHWEPRHLEQVKTEYRRRYDERLEEAIAEEVMSSSTGSDWGEFCIGLAQIST
ncbi:hypothetical protein N7462_001761 [Penicillium macrosclerotiorum]|uniref:uncharacterized protein n=1 Tax=Penicillium macrosclerotiorum TaxID=303699 RepID=UPI002546C3A2|nr:uncharacterized protein N7462_001761 [Penicillium macrosclerotiorum]KAJ5692338.1 hypothetical protein N7462_001761 [Penicillium macrosclerotiorum]